jgi:hypothetical protein
VVRLRMYRKRRLFKDCKIMDNGCIGVMEESSHSGIVRICAIVHIDAREVAYINY